MTGNRFWTSLSFQQTTRGLSVALILGLGLTTLELGWSASRERDKVARLAEQILNLLDGAATVAVWTFDPDLGHRVTADALTLDAVQGLDLLYKDGRVLAESSRPRAVDADGVSQLVFSDLLTVERPVYRPRTDDETQVRGEPTGFIRVHLDPSVVSADFWAFVGNALVGGILRNFLLGLALTLVFHRTLTRPLLELSRNIEQIDPTAPENHNLPVPTRHRRDELGTMTERINGLLRRLTSVQADLRRLSTRDPVTQLANRALFTEALAAALVRQGRGERGLAVLVLRVPVEPLRKGGDRALVHLAGRLTDCVARTEMTARLSGNEFAVLLPETDSAAAMRVADRITATLDHGMTLPEGWLDFSGTVGVSLAPADGTEGEELIARARAAAEGGSERIRFASPLLLGEARNQLLLADALLAAVESGAIRLFCQQQLDTGSNNVTGLAIRAEWHAPQAVLAGETLFAAAQSVRLDVALSDHLMRRAVATMKAETDLPWMVRCAPRQLEDPDFTGMISRLCLAAGVSPARLQLLVPQSAASFPALASLRGAGFALWLDVTDPGSLGLAVLEAGLFTGVELRSPVAGEDVSRSFTAVVQMADGLGIVTAARGVDGAAQWATLVRAGCKRLRGDAVGAEVTLAWADTETQQPAGTGHSGRSR